MSEQQPNQVQIKATDEKLKGEYANVMRVQHTKEEFVLDFMNIFEQHGTLNARVIVSPGHFKRLLAAMAENLAKYESQFGDVKASEAPTSKIGFQG